MKRNLFQNIISLSVLLILILMFQNCKITSSNSKTPPLITSELNDSFKTGISCPTFKKPLCKNDEPVSLVENEQSCTYAVCIKDNAAMTCPKYPSPICNPNEIITQNLDQHGCAFPKCESEDVAIQCPTEETPTCEDGEEELTPHKKINGCLSMICAKKTFAVCEAPSTPTCRNDEYLTKKIDKNRCIKPLCKSKRYASCLIYNKPFCGAEEELSSRKNESGCSIPVCRTKDQSLACPIYRPKRCNNSTTLKFKFDANGCKHNYCG